MSHSTEIRWVSCSRDASWSASRVRHLVRRGCDTTACGATATSPGIWRANSSKPKCQACINTSAGADLQRLVAEVRTGMRGYSEGDLRAVAKYLADAVVAMGEAN